MGPTVSTHIEMRSNRDGQRRAFIAGTRIKVRNVYVLSELHGRNPDEIVSAYPHLSLAQVHAALSYYFDHMDEIHAELQEDKAFLEQFRAISGPGPLDQKLEGMDGPGDSVSS